MRTVARAGILLAVAATVAIVIIAKQRQPEAVDSSSAPAEAESQTGGPARPECQPAGPLPQLVEFGGSRCLTCQRMIPVLRELKRRYEGRLKVDMVDVFVDQRLARARGIRLIPTQVFYDASGRELDRHEGPISIEEIVAAWKRLGIDLDSAPRTKPDGG